MKRFKLQNGIFDRKRRLIITPEFVEFESAYSGRDRFQRMLKQDIIDIKFGSQPIVWYQFTVGKKYSIVFKTKEDKTLNIEFRHYRWSQKHYEKPYAEILKSIWDYFLHDLVNQKLSFWRANGNVIIGRMNISSNGIEVLGTGLSFTWNNLVFKESPTYFQLARKDAPEFHMIVDFNTWDAQVLYHVIKDIRTEIIQSKQPA
jgi:hypothetical protein